MISDALTKRPIVEKHYKTNQMLWTEQDESQSVCLNQYLQVKYSFFFVCFIWHVHLNSQCIYIVTYKPHDVCVTVLGVAIICTFTTSLHTPFTSVPELGATSQPFARGTKQPYSYTGSDEWFRWWVFRKQRDYSAV